MLKKLEGQLLKEVTALFVNEIGSAILDGVNYVLLSRDNPKQELKSKKYKALAEKLSSSGYAGEVLDYDESVSGGDIFVLNENVAMNLGEELLESVNRLNSAVEGAKIFHKEYVRAEVKKALRSEILALCGYLTKQYEQGRKKGGSDTVNVDLVLFSRNKGNYARFSVVDKRGNKGLLSYRCFNLTTDALLTVNKILADKGLNIGIVRLDTVTSSGVICSFQLQRKVG